MQQNIDATNHKLNKIQKGQNAKLPKQTRQIQKNSIQIGKVQRNKIQMQQITN